MRLPHAPAPARDWPGPGRALVLLAIGAGIAFLWLARELLVPAVLGVVLALSVHPLVAFLERRKVPRSVAAIAGTLLATAVVVGIGILLYDRISSFVDELPGYEGRLRALATGIRRHLGHLQAQGEQIVQAPRQPGKVQVQEGVPWTALLLGTAQGALAIAAEATVAVFVLYFSLAEGPRYREKFLSHAGRTPIGRARARAALAELHRDVEQYMLNRVALNAVLGVVMWIVYGLYGLEHAAIWGITTALLHFVPYVGPAIGFVLPTAMAVLQYGRPRDVLLVGGIYLALVSIQGNVVDPIFLGKQLRLSALAVFLGSLFWFWLWGPLGLFLAVPLLSTTRIVCKYLPRFRTIADFLAE
ncbi:AI-2E family transporter [Anaeromyxobacter oryzae]|uniref:AI-2E family transporter n=1 Tax=Anaeromyxobacter oryzae TaxID=2918170 RepID=A0ABM7WRI6_9BACT|nr:AI-2E family transporter [Anaeromyxobacter oryzae]BDG02080.1 AI-2E family transporter [Anaeromyxobacter oryzae]